MTRRRHAPGVRLAACALLLAGSAALLGACAGGQKKDEPSPWEKAADAKPADGKPATAPSEGASAAAAHRTATPLEAQRAREFFSAAVQLEASGKPAAAVGAFERAFELDPGLSWAGLDAGLLRERAGDDGRAVALYQRTLEAAPGFAPAGQNLARAWIRLGKAEEGQRALRSRLAQGDGVGLRLGLAELLLATGQLDDAEAESRAALKASEKSVPAMVTLATVYGRKKRYELARMVLENARQVDPDEPAVWNRLGFTELALGNRPQALEAFKAAAALRPDYPEAHANYGALLADADDFAGAARELELAVKYAPRAAGAWLSLGNAHRGLQAFDKAEAAYRKALELDPGLTDAHFDLAVLYLDVEKPGLPTLKRLEQGVAFFDAYEKAGGSEPRVAAYRKDAARDIDREKKRLAREEKDRVRKEAEARKKAEEAAQEAAKPAAAAAPAAAGGPAGTAGQAESAGPTAPAPAVKATSPAAKAAPAAAKPTAKPAAKPAAKKAPAATSTPGGAASGGTRGSPGTAGGKLGEEGGDK